MSDEPDDAERPRGERRNPFRAKKRITLAFKGPPLALPGAGQKHPSDPPPAFPARSPEPIDTPHDGWSRDRVARGSDAHRPVTKSHFPPPPPGATAPESKGAGGALDLVNRRHPSETALDHASEMTDRFALDDFTGALLSAELILGRDPNHLEAARYAELCRDRLDHLYSTRLGGMKAVPRLTVPSTEVRWLGLDHRAGFLLSLIDGEHSLDELLDLAAMPRLAVLKTLIELLDAGTIQST